MSGSRGIADLRKCTAGDELLSMVDTLIIENETQHSPKLLGPNFVTGEVLTRRSSSYEGKYTVGAKGTLQRYVPTTLPSGLRWGEEAALVCGQWLPNKSVGNDCNDCPTKGKVVKCASQVVVGSCHTAWISSMYSFLDKSHRGCNRHSFAWNPT